MLKFVNQDKEKSCYNSSIKTFSWLKPTKLYVEITKFFSLSSSCIFLPKDSLMKITLSVQLCDRLNSEHSQSFCLEQGTPPWEDRQKRFGRFLGNKVPWVVDWALMWCREPGGLGSTPGSVHPSKASGLSGLHFGKRICEVGLQDCLIAKWTRKAWVWFSKQLSSNEFLFSWPRVNLSRTEQRSASILFITG